jgi:hypothetical protein
LHVIKLSIHPSSVGIVAGSVTGDNLEGSGARPTSSISVSMAARARGAAGAGSGGSMNDGPGSGQAQGHVGGRLGQLAGSRVGWRRDVKPRERDARCDAAAEECRLITARVWGITRRFVLGVETGEHVQRRFDSGAQERASRLIVRVDIKHNSLLAEVLRMKIFFIYLLFYFIPQVLSSKDHRLVFSIVLTSCHCLFCLWNLR